LSEFSLPILDFSNLLVTDTRSVEVPTQISFWQL